MFAVSNYYLHVVVGMDDGFIFMENMPVSLEFLASRALYIDEFRIRYARMCGAASSEKTGINE